jgi:hypothetical protein
LVIAAVTLVPTLSILIAAGYIPEWTAVSILTLLIAAVAAIVAAFSAWFVLIQIPKPKWDNRSTAQIVPGVSGEEGDAVHWNFKIVNVGAGTAFNVRLKVEDTDRQEIQDRYENSVATDSELKYWHLRFVKEASSTHTTKNGDELAEQMRSTVTVTLYWIEQPFRRFKHSQKSSFAQNAPVKRE